MLRNCHEYSCSESWNHTKADRPWHVWHVWHVCILLVTYPRLDVVSTHSKSISQQQCYFYKIYRTAGTHNKLLQQHSATRFHATTMRQQWWADVAQSQPIPSPTRFFLLIARFCSNVTILFDLTNHFVAFLKLSPKSSAEKTERLRGSLGRVELKQASWRTHCRHRLISRICWIFREQHVFLRCAYM